jgi:hypothetical protein
VDGNANAGNADIIECYADNHVDLVQQVKIRATTASTDTTRGVGGASGGAGIQGNVNVGGNAIILSDIEQAAMRMWIMV